MYRALARQHEPLFRKSLLVGRFVGANNLLRTRVKCISLEFSTGVFFFLFFFFLQLSYDLCYSRLVDANWIACSLGIDPSLLITLGAKITGGRGNVR